MLRMAEKILGKKNERGLDLPQEKKTKHTMKPLKLKV